MIVDLDNNHVTIDPQLSSTLEALPWPLSWRLFHGIRRHFNVFAFTHPGAVLAKPENLPLHATEEANSASSKQKSAGLFKFGKGEKEGENDGEQKVRSRRTSGGKFFLFIVLFLSSLHSFSLVLFPFPSFPFLCSPSVQPRSVQC